MTTQIELFDRCAAIVFAKLYEAFPLRIDIDSTDIPMELFDDTDSTWQVTHKFDVYESTIRWLRDAGYVWASDVDGRKTRDVVLTPKGLEILKLPSSLSTKKESVGQLLTDVVKRGAKDAAQKAVSSALTVGFKLMVGEIAGGAGNGVQV